MQEKVFYIHSKIKTPETNAEFWLAVLQVRNHYLAEACADHIKYVDKTGDYFGDHVWYDLLKLDFWLDQAFCEWRS